MEWTNSIVISAAAGVAVAWPPLHKVATLQAMGLLDTMAASIELTATPAPPLALKCAKWRTAGDWAAEQKRFLSLRKGGMTARAHKLIARGDKRTSEFPDSGPPKWRCGPPNWAAGTQQKPRGWGGAKVSRC